MNFPTQPQPSKTQWLDDYKKLSSLYQQEERNLIQTFLKDDYHLSKIYTTLLKTDILSEQKAFTDTEKQLKLFINEAHSYFQSKTLSKATTNNIRTKVKKIDDLLLKTRKDFKTKFDSLLMEEDILEKELQQYESQFETYFPSSTSSMPIDNAMLNTEEQQQQQQQQTVIGGNKIETITLYVQNIITSPGMIIDTLTPSYSDIETIVKRCAYAQLSQLKEKVELIDNVIDKKLGGVTLTWQSKEHEDFLKVKNIHNNKINTYEFLTELANTIPYLPPSELKNHIKLYDKYAHLNEVKKLLLRRYKELKLEKDEQEKQKVMERLRLEKEKYGNTKQHDKQHVQQELEEKKQRVREWKQMKEKQNTKMLKHKQEQERKVKEKERQQYMLIKARNQDLISEYKKRKEYETYCKQQEHLNKNTAHVVDPIDMERIKEREEELLEKRRNVIRAKSSKQLPYDTTYARYKLKPNKKYSGITTKLNELTTGSKNKQRLKFNPQTDQAKDACTMANNLLGHMSRGVPAWRKGM